MNSALPRWAALLLLGCHGTRAAADTPLAATDRAAQVQAIFAAKCAECHGPREPQPKGGVSLAEPGQVAANTDLVVPGRPEDSALWEVIRTGEMPPHTARAGPLNEREKETLHAWIAALAPGPPRPQPTVLYRQRSHARVFSLGWVGSTSS